jgi:cell division protein FtsA
MEKENIAVGLDIGTTKIVAMIGKKNEVREIRCKVSKSLGVARGVVNNIKPYNIQQAIQEAENNSGYKIKDVVVELRNTSAVFNTPIISVKQSRRGYWQE